MQSPGDEKLDQHDPALKPPHDDDRKQSTTKPNNDEYAASRRSKFRLKTKPSSKRRSSNNEDNSKHRTRDDSRHHHQPHHRRKRHKSSHSEERHMTPPLSPNTAFRESLFDALADDEGAAYWEGIYGQPIHTYPRPDELDGRGKLERMTDDEYAAYVRARMWEKTHQAILEERERRRRQRQAEKEAKHEHEQRKAEGDREAFERMVDESLRRGRERKEKKTRDSMWVDIWRRYLGSWKDLDARAAREAAVSGNGESGAAGSSGLRLRNLIVWPVESGRRRDVTPQAVEEFIRNMPFQVRMGSRAAASGQEGSSTNPYYPDILTALKIERVRWHPDKIKHRYGILGMEDQLNKSATEVFQILDRMWVEERAKS
ncbi:hypothetical protein PRK78_002549 [Emydomyces testavorans]|uniref:Uncharacterized protein n=1 Tax=Emydomyces testavorans TaxID=2070801 RepID=A0AAF0IJR8_9EURO|nr:hypothetical protein PRK78_002549 [Emydomyces testavorans]